MFTDLRNPEIVAREQHSSEQTGSVEDYFDGGAFARMAAQLAEIKGVFLLSINDTPAMRETFGAFNLEEARVSYTVSRAAADGEKARELIVSNRAREDRLL